MRINTDVSHLQQLRKGQIALDKRTQEAPIRKLLEQTEHFVFTGVPEHDEEIEASVEAMRQAGGFRLPYPVCTFEFTANLCLLGDVKFPEERTIMLLTDDGTGPRCDHWFVRSAANKHKWICITFDGTSAPDEVPDDCVAVGIEVKGGPETATTRGSIADIGASLLVALATRGIQRERWCGDKKVLVGRTEPSNTYTRVMVAECLERGDASPGSSPGRR